MNKSSSLPDWLSSPQNQIAAKQLIDREISRRKLAFYKPYAKQLAFHASGLVHRERLFRAGNQLGKTIGGSAEAAIHATGRYPAWWNGYRFDKHTSGWCSGVTGEVTRDSIQRLLIGSVGDRGTGFIPPGDIVDITPSRGVADLVDTILVRHISGGLSRIRLKYFEQGREKFQADTLDWAWNDEEPPEDIYSEVLTRTNATNGIVWTTFTPLKGMSTVVRRFIMEQSPDRDDINMTIDDAEHISAEQKRKIIASYPAHEREARINGTPALGSGRIFPITEESIKVPRFEIPKWMKIIGGLDFGWDHPTAASKLAYDPDTDTVYVIACYRRKEATPVIHASSLKAWGKVTFAWPHDGLQHDKGSGMQLAELYRREGIEMQDNPARFDDDRGNGVEAGLMEMLTRMETGRFKVFDHLLEWFEEFRLYHREEGKVVKEFDDIICSTRYALMRIGDAEATRDSTKKRTATSGSWMVG